MLIGYDGDVLTARRHVEWPLRTEGMAARPEIAGAVHSHPPHALAFGAAQQSLRAVSHAGRDVTWPEDEECMAKRETIWNAPVLIQLWNYPVRTSDP